MELHGDVGLERWVRRMQLDKEEFLQRVAEERRRFEQRMAQKVEAEKTRAEEELAHVEAVMEARRAPTEGLAVLPPELLVKVLDLLPEVVAKARTQGGRVSFLQGCGRGAGGVRWMASRT